jgi:hypothetical protein
MFQACLGAAAPWEACTSDVQLPALSSIGGAVPPQPAFKTRSCFFLHRGAGRRHSVILA